LFSFFYTHLWEFLNLSPPPVSSEFSEVETWGWGKKTGNLLKNNV
jgi:hypothetical protein